MINRRNGVWVQVRDINGDDERFDVLFWQSQGSDAIFHAAWGMVVTANELKGRSKDELEFQRSAVSVQSI